MSHGSERQGVSEPRSAKDAHASGMKYGLLLAVRAIRELRARIGIEEADKFLRHAERVIERETVKADNMKGPQDGD